jgi:hypothetical protein
MTKPSVKIVDAISGEEIEREMTDIEYQSFLENEKKSKDFTADIIEQHNKKMVLLERLGITEAEAKLLLS